MHDAAQGPTGRRESLRQVGSAESKLQQLIDRQRFFVAGQPVELWENPRLPFGCTVQDLEAYCVNARWDLLFNAIVIVCNASHESDDDEPIRPGNRCLWAGEPGAPPDVGH